MEEKETIQNDRGNVEESKKIPIIKMPDITDNNRLSITGEPESSIEDGLINAKYISKVKLGEGLSIASMMFGIFALIFGSFGLMSYRGEYALISLPWSIAAIITGIIGNRYQRLISNKFGLGVAGAVIGLFVLITALIFGYIMS